MTLLPFIGDADQGVLGDPSGISDQQRQQERGDWESATEQYETYRRYYGGEQYDVENDDLATRAGFTAQHKRMPEHMRKHAYSSHISECVDFLADMLAKGVSFEGSNADEVNDWWTQADMNQRIDDWFRDALICGDVYGEPDWDPATEKVSLDIWEAESVWPVYDQRDWRRLDHWYRFQTLVDADGVETQEIRLSILQTFFEEVSGAIVQGVVEYRYLDDRYVDQRVLGLPFFDLVHARGDTRQRLRSQFGDTMVSRKIQGSADRYNALGQLGFRVARQNSFATLGIVGDAALAGGALRDDMIPKDIADVLTFPGGTSLVPIELPTDPRMLQHQMSMLEKNIYKDFGLSKTDIEDIGGLGTVSGYALEVLNRKDRATNDRIRKNAIAGIRALANKMLDVVAVRQGTAEGRNWWEIDPVETFPNREGLEVSVGSGDVVDATGDRDDYTARIVSRRYVLRRKGLSTPDILRVETELAAEDDAVMERQMEATSQQAELEKEQAIEVARTQAALRPSGGQAASSQAAGR